MLGLRSEQFQKRSAHVPQIIVIVGRLKVQKRYIKTERSSEREEGIMHLLPESCERSSGWERSSLQVRTMLQPWLNTTGIINALNNNFIRQHN